ncbi:hypothetical protein FOA52_013989 [Chlamydomonas sp. UWO 241]|nr:hypothetical protein FOA52_013989 [Chlamydomonas sp. UWO 241]
MGDHRTLPFSGVLYPNECHQYYDIDQGRKMSLAKSVELSPQRLAILRSSAPRFKESGNSVPFGVYDTDTGPKQMMESWCRDNRRFYASAFESKTPRLGRHTSAPTDAMYDPQCTMNSKPNCIVKDIQDTGIKYAIHRSKYKRFNERVGTEAADVSYNTDTGSKMSMATAVGVSPRKYHNLGASTGRPSTQACSEIAPGMYNPKIAADISISPHLDVRPLSSLMSRSLRFGKSSAQGFGLGSTYRPEVDAKTWTGKDKGGTMAKSAILRPSYLPKSYAAKGKA